jgi:phosphoribosyl 1,2-cyclic phosphodiesterase
MSFKLKFWGVRGSIACPGRDFVVYGGNTSCIEVAADGERFIFDGGTGIRNLGHWLLKKQVHNATLLFSHSHWDHINGVPFFTPAYKKEHAFRIMAGHLTDTGGVEHVFAGQMQLPYFPVLVGAMQASLSYHDFRAGETLKLGQAGRVTVRTAPLNHPNGATGYRIEYGGRSVCYVTDTEHVPGAPDQNVLGLIEGADLVIYDSTYSDEEFQAHLGWGHSTWQEGIRLCRMAGAKRLAIFHHDPDHDDCFMDKLAFAARREWSGAFVAREGMRLDLNRLNEEAQPHPLHELGDNLARLSDRQAS